MFASSARIVPASFRSVDFVSTSTSSPFTATSMPSGLTIFRVPFGPLTCSACALTEHSTPLGSATGILATRDIEISLRDGADDFAAKTLRACLRVGHDAGGSRDDRNTETAEDLR